MKKDKSGLHQIESQVIPKASLLHALNMAAVVIQDSARSELDIMQVFSMQIKQLGLRGGILFVDESRNLMTVKAFVQPEPLIEELEKETGLNCIGFSFRFKNIDVYQQVIEAETPLFVDNSAQIIEQLLPKKARTVSRRIINNFGAPAAVYAPIKYEDQVKGVLYLAGDEINSNDVPVIELFANHISVALNKARLFAEMELELANRRFTEAELRKLKEFNEDIIQTMFEGVSLLNSDGYITFVNPAAAELLGYSTEELVGKHWKIITPSDQHAIVDAADKRRIQGISDRYEMELQRKDGHRIQVLISGSPRFDHDRFDGTLVVFTEISDRKRMEESLRNRANELSELNAFSIDIGSFWDLPDLLENIAMRTVKLLKSEGGCVSLCDYKQGIIDTYVEYPQPSFQGEDLGKTLKIGEGARGQVAQTGKPLIIDDYRTWPNRAIVYEEEKPYRAVLTVPMAGQDQLFGVLQVWENTTSRKYTEKDQNLLSLFANQAAMAIENARLFEAERTARRRAEALREAARIIASTLSLKEVLDAVLEQLSRVLQYDSGNIMLVEDELLVIKAWRGYDAFIDTRLEDADTFPINGENSASVVVLTGEPVAIAGVDKDPHWAPNPASKHIRSWLGVPLVVRDRVIGLLNLDRTKEDGFTEEEIALAQVFALHAATAIENARLFESEGQRATEQEALRQASLSLTASLELEDVLDAILKTAHNLLPGVNNGHIFLFAEEDKQLTFGASLWADGRRGEPLAIPRPEGLTYTVARTGQLVVVSDMVSHPLYEGAPEDWKGAIVGLPLNIGKRVVGVMNLAYQNPREFSETELRVLELLGDQAAIAIENARLFNQAAIERRHLGLLYDLGRDLEFTLDPEEILYHAIALTTQAMNGLVGEAFIYLPEEDRLSLRALYGKPQTLLAEYDERIQMRPGVGLAGWVAENAQAVIIPDVNQDDRWLHVSGIDEDVHSAICSPIMVEDRLVGVITVLHQQEAVFNKDHLILLQAICQQVGLAFSNSSRYQEVKRRLTEITLIQTLAQTFSQRLDLKILLDEVVSQLSQRLGYPLVEIFLIEDDKMTLRSVHGLAPPTSTLSIDRGIIGRVARTGQATFVPDVSKDPDYCADIKDTVSELVVPIFRDEKVVGIINIESNRLNQLSWHDLDLLRVLAGQVSIALENAVLYDRVLRHAEDLEKIVTQRTAELTELYQLSQKIGYTISYEELFMLLVSHLRSAIGSELAAACLVKDGVRFIVVETTRPLSPAVLDRLRMDCINNLHIGNGNDTDISQIPIEVNLVEEKRSKTTIMKNLASMQVPIYVRQNNNGLLIVANERSKLYGEEQERLLQTFANQAAAAIERLEAIIAAEQKRLGGLMEHLPTGVLLIDSDNRLLVVNQMGKEILALLNPEFSDGVLNQLGDCPIEKLISQHTDPMPVEVALDGIQQRFFEAQAQPVGGTSHQWVITLRETTQERDSQIRIQMQDRLATVGQLAAGIAHDFNNIMAAILVYADLLKSDSTLSHVSKDRLEIIQQQVQRAASLIRQILDFSRRSVMEQSLLDLLPFIKEFEKMLHRIIPETIHLELICQPGVYMVNGDPTRLQQVLLNLALNARDAMPNGGLLQFKMSHHTYQDDDRPSIPDMPVGEWVKISVKDTGAGIPPEIMSHIFEPFFTTKPIGLGTGLGLAQVYGIVQQHNGYIDVESKVGEGTVFTIYLPSFPVTLDEDYFQDIPEKMDGVGETVLVVEDDPTTLEALITLLQAHNFRVVSASDGRDALEQYQQSLEPIRIVISDVVMPKMGGLELYRELIERSPEVKMLFITGHPLEKESQEFLQTGNVHWLQKPFSLREIGQAIRDLLDS